MPQPSMDLGIPKKEKAFDIAEKWAKELKFIPKVDKLRIIRGVAEECGVLKD